MIFDVIEQAVVNNGILMAWLAIIVGLIVLVWSADQFIDGAQNMALHLGMSPLLVGILIVGFGTSAPEMMISALAALKESPGIAIGNAFGSNVANIGLILGLTALITPIAAGVGIIKKEFPALILVTLGVFVIMYDGHLSRIDGIILLATLIGILVWFARSDMVTDSDNPTTGSTAIDNVPKTPTTSLQKAIVWTLIGLALLMGASQMFVWGATEVAVYFGVSDVVIGLTIVALGTSLPELAASLAAIRKNEHDMALGNVVGSNLFNTLAVIGIAAIIHPLDYARNLLIRDWGIMFALTLALFIFACRFGKVWQVDPATGLLRKLRLERYQGALLLTAYIAYMVFLALSAFD